MKHGAMTEALRAFVIAALLARSSLGFETPPLIGEPALIDVTESVSLIENVAIGATRLGHRGLAAASLRLDRDEEQKLLGWSMHLLERVGLGAKAWEPAGALPLGHQRVLEIARALAADPLLLLLDEPAAGLRANEKAELAALLGGLRDDGLGILLVEHDVDFVSRLADRLR